MTPSSFFLIFFILSSVSTRILNNVNAFAIGKDNSNSNKSSRVSSRRNEGERVLNEKKSSNKQQSNKSYQKVNRQEIGYSNRANGIRTKRTKPPRWETEGDSLFFLHDERKNDGSDNGDFTNTLEGTIDANMNIAEYLESTFKQKNKNTVNSKSKRKEDQVTQSPSLEKDEEKNKNMTPMWGNIPIGPIFKSKILNLLNESSNPTPIQEKAFTLLAKRKNAPNAVIASPTGSGKTLSYLLPLLAITSRKEFGRILIITPSVDLSLQIQRVASQLWDDKAVYVIQSPPSTSTTTASSTRQLLGWNVEEMKLLKAPILTGTPKSILQLLSYIDSNTIENKSIGGKASRSSNNSNHIFNNLGTIVLDEADRLLQTELVARRDSMKENKKSSSISTQKSKNSHKHKASSNSSFMDNCTTRQLLNMIEKKSRISFDVSQDQQNHYIHLSQQVQLICASATVGRTLRRQIMDITNASSIDKGSILITADDRTGKDETRRKSSLLPDTLQHSYAIFDDDDDDNNKESKDSNTQDIGYCIKKSTESLIPAPTIIFPGKIGVQTLANLLETYGFTNIRTLRDKMDWNQDDQKQMKNVDSSTSSEIIWSSMPIYIVGEKFGRGLDIPDVKYVFISTPPNSPAAYAHLAGRTGRAGKFGAAITIVRNLKDAKRLVSLAKKLGIQFKTINDIYSTNVEGKCSDNLGKIDDTNAASSNINEKLNDSRNDNLSSTSSDNIPNAENLNNLTVATLKAMLKQRNLKVSGKKNDLIMRLQEFYSCDSK